MRPSCHFGAARLLGGGLGDAMLVGHELEYQVSTLPSVTSLDDPALLALGKAAFERYASARSHKSTLTRLGGGMRCMHISITLDAVMIRPHFPFSLAGADSDLVHEIPIQKITGFRIDPHVRTFGASLDFERDRSAGRIDLDLKRPTEFIATITELKKRTQPKTSANS